MLADRRPILVPVPQQCGHDQYANFVEYLSTCPGMELHRSTVVDVACTQPSEDVYSGDVRLRQSVELKFGDFVAYFQAKAAGTSHWLMDTENDLHFYLAQCPLLSTSTDVPAVLPHLLPAMASLRPPILDNIQLTQINLWMTIASSDTSVHYDAYENVLHVLQGTKCVRLYPPSATPVIQAHAIYSKSSNHTTLSLAQTKALPHFIEFDVHANMALYIPEGWWHQVRSEPLTVAMNYWFDGMRPTLVAQPAMVPYYARVLVEDLVRTARLKAVHATIAQSRQRLLNKGVLARLTSVDALEAFVVNAKGGTDKEDALLTAPPTLLYSLILRLSERQPSVWSAMLEEASVELVEFLTDAWDDHDALSRHSNGSSPPAYFAAVFACCDFDVQEVLLAKKDAFGRQSARHVMASMFGFE
ncbi:hypothetical protein H257_03590, partial [Aphanomyces astaci]